MALTPPPITPANPAIPTAVEQAASFNTPPDNSWPDHSQYPNQTFQPSIDFNPANPDKESRAYNYKEIGESSLHQYVTENKYNPAMNPSWNIRQIRNQINSPYGEAILTHPTMRDYAWSEHFKSRTAYTDAQHNVMEDFELLLKKVITGLTNKNTYLGLTNKTTLYKEQLIETFLQIIRVATCKLNLKTILSDKEIKTTHNGAPALSISDEDLTVYIYSNTQTNPTLFFDDNGTLFKVAEADSKNSSKERHKMATN